MLLRPKELIQVSRFTNQPCNLPVDIASLFGLVELERDPPIIFLRGIKHCSSSFFSFFHRPLQTLLRAPLYFLPASFPFLLAAEECWFGFGMGRVSEREREWGAICRKSRRGSRKRKEGAEGEDFEKCAMSSSHRQTLLGAGGPETEKRASVAEHSLFKLPNVPYRIGLAESKKLRNPFPYCQL